MFAGIWGKKVGMTQMFSEKNEVVPVTMIDVSQWLVTQVKSKDKDGYSSIQVGCVRPEHASEQFSKEWLKKAKKYFSAMREISVLTQEGQLPEVGQRADVGTILAQGDRVDVTGITIGRGFQGVMKRHGFSGGKASHGGKLGRRPGSLSFMRRQGRVPKGKKMPGHMGVEQRITKNLTVVKVEPAAQVVVVSGSVPGKSGSLVFIGKHHLAGVEK